ncbi:hypothetical protein [Thermus scotoductus]|uniref:Bacterial Pleckstrin homology domain-containing protein n=1 Tax=Thermus scotoductus TaxID=37636 RepID=A0A430V2M5_THESC|nr:hypothetical protein [Thermus scotoductus]RTH20309.1 hypothetical protein CSW41_02615 [Thermus scotoductus]RTI17086.1 hypothetical protein CSW27_02490 [Thermus scotoductus]
MRLHPKREGNPRGFFLGIFILATLAALGVVFWSLWEDPESLPLLLALLLLEIPLTGAFLLWLSSLPGRLSYELAGPVLTVHLPFGRRSVHRSEVTEVRLLHYTLPWWSYRYKGEASMPGYHHRKFRLSPQSYPGGLPVEAFVGARRGEGVLLVLKNGSGLLLNPEDPPPLLKWKGEA